MGASKMLMLLWFLNCHLLSAVVRKSSAEDHDDELAGRGEMVFAGPIGRSMGC
jgi:hypothetical protein